MATFAVLGTFDTKGEEHRYVADRCAFRYVCTTDAAHARALEKALKKQLRPVLNPE